MGIFDRLRQLGRDVGRDLDALAKDPVGEFRRTAGLDSGKKQEAPAGQTEATVEPIVDQTEAVSHSAADVWRPQTGEGWAEGDVEGEYVQQDSPEAKRARFAEMEARNAQRMAQREQAQLRVDQARQDALDRQRADAARQDAAVFSSKPTGAASRRPSWQRTADRRRDDQHRREIADQLRRQEAAMRGPERQSEAERDAIRLQAAQDAVGAAEARFGAGSGLYIDAVNALTKLQDELRRKEQRKRG